MLKKKNHVNNAENRHSLLRPFLNMFKGVSKKNLNTYIKFLQFTYKNGIKWLQKNTSHNIKNNNTQKDKSKNLFLS